MCARTPYKWDYKKSWDALNIGASLREWAGNRYCTKQQIEQYCMHFAFLQSGCSAIYHIFCIMSQQLCSICIPCVSPPEGLRIVAAYCTSAEYSITAYKICLKTFAPFGARWDDPQICVVVYIGTSLLLIS